MGLIMKYEVILFEGFAFHIQGHKSSLIISIHSLRLYNNFI